VSAIFIVTLAQGHLEAPHNPPQSQQDLLATALQPIVSFVVLGSVLARTFTYFHFQGHLFIFTHSQMGFRFHYFL
jgi:hypothetical protein